MIELLFGEWGNREWGVGSGEWALGSREWGVGSGFVVRNPSVKTTRYAY
jgi:hypothetical protein